MSRIWVLYWRYGRGIWTSFDTLEQAYRFLGNGESEGSLSSDKIVFGRNIAHPDDPAQIIIDEIIDDNHVGMDALSHIWTDDYTESDWDDVRNKR